MLIKKTHESACQLSQNICVRVFWEVRQPLLGLPLVGYVVGGGITGAVYGTAILGGLWVGYGVLVINLIRREIAFRLDCMRSYCPVCLTPFEGHKVCPHCGQKLPAVAYVPGTRLVRCCPSCGKRIGKGSEKPRERCFSETCLKETEPDNIRWSELFAAKTIVYRIALCNRPWLPGGDWDAIRSSDCGQTYGKAGDRYAVLLDVRESRRFGGEGISTRQHAVVNEIWVHRGVPVNALQAIKQIQYGNPVRVSFEASRKEMGAEAEGFTQSETKHFPEIAYGVPLDKWMEEAKEIIERRGKR